MISTYSARVWNTINCSLPMQTFFRSYSSQASCQHDIVNPSPHSLDSERKLRPVWLQGEIKAIGAYLSSESTAWNLAHTVTAPPAGWWTELHVVQERVSAQSECWRDECWKLHGKKKLFMLAKLPAAQLCKLFKKAAELQLGHESFDCVCPPPYLCGKTPPHQTTPTNQFAHRLCCIRAYFDKDMTKD